MQNRAGDRNPLAFAAGELLAALADLCVVAVRLLDDEVICVGRFGGSHDLLRRRPRPRS